MEKNYNKVVVIFCRPMKKGLKSGTFSADKLADKLADCRPTVGGVNVITVLLAKEWALNINKLSPGSLPRKSNWLSQHNLSYYCGLKATNQTNKVTLPRPNEKMCSSGCSLKTKKTTTEFSYGFNCFLCWTIIYQIYKLVKYRKLLI